MPFVPIPKRLEKVVEECVSCCESITIIFKSRIDGEEEEFMKITSQSQLREFFNFYIILSLERHEGFWKKLKEFREGLRALK